MCQAKSNIYFLAYDTSLQDALSLHGTPPITSHYSCLSDFCIGTAINEGEQGEKRGMVNNQSFAALLEGTSITQAASAHESRSEQERMSPTNPLTAKEGELWEDMVTTMFIRHIPHGCTSTKFMKFIDLLGFKGLYDYYYQPLDHQTHEIRTYAFINFVTPAIAKSFQITTHCIQVHRGGCEGQSLCVVPSREQGLQSNIARYHSRTSERRKKHKRSCPIFPPVDFQKIPLAESRARQVIDGLPEMRRSLGWEPATSMLCV